MRGTNRLAVNIAPGTSLGLNGLMPFPVQGCGQDMMQRYLFAVLRWTHTCVYTVSHFV